MGIYISDIILAIDLLKKVRKTSRKKQGQRKECKLETGAWGGDCGKKPSESLREQKRKDKKDQPVYVHFL